MAKSKETVSPKKPMPQTPSKIKKEIKSLFAILPILPHVLVIAICIGVYYAITTYYIFFDWGIYIYYALKVIVAYTILSASVRSLWIPLIALIIGLLILFTNSVYLTTLMSAETAYELTAVALIGLLIALFVRL